MKSNCFFFCLSFHSLPFFRHFSFPFSFFSHLPFRPFCYFLYSISCSPAFIFIICLRFLVLHFLPFFLLLSPLYSFSLFPPSLQLNLIYFFVSLLPSFPCPLLIFLFSSCFLSLSLSGQFLFLRYFSNLLYLPPPFLSQTSPFIMSSYFLPP